MFYILAFFSFAFSLSLSYQHLFLPHSYLWVSAALIHSGWVILLYFTLGTLHMNGPRDFQDIPPRTGVALVPILVVAFFCIGLVVSAKEWQEPFLSWSLVGFCIWVPLVEEIFFRSYLSHAFRRQMGQVVGTYLSVLLFSFLHSEATPLGIWEGTAGITLGPLFLSIFCEAIYAWGKRLEYAIVFHGICNLSAYIASRTHPELLEHLWFFYG